MRGFFRFLVWMLILAGVLMGLLWAVGFRITRLPMNDPVFTVSLKPTLNEGDLVITQGISEPVYGDLVLCPEPGAEERYIIGRIIGEPGDQVVINNGKALVNGEGFRQEYNCNDSPFEYPHPNSDGEVVQQACGWEVIAGRTHKTGYITKAGRREKRDFQVPEEHFFIFSDNRQFPYDSRDFGTAQIDSCRATVIGRLWSKDGWFDSKNRLNYIR